MENKITIEDIIKEQSTLVRIIMGIKQSNLGGVLESTNKMNIHIAEELKRILEFIKLGINADDKEIIVNYTRWLKVLLTSYGIDRMQVAGILQGIVRALQIRYEERLDIRVIESIDNMMQILREEDSKSESAKEVDERCRTYINYVVNYKKVEAVRFIFDIYQKEEISIQKIYLEILQPAMHEIGRLWKLREITVAQEHYSTAVTQWIMTKLYPEIFSVKKLHQEKSVFVGVSVPGELHEVGIRMVSDFFELEGWNVYYIGANIPRYSLIKFLKEHSVDVLGISVTMYTYVEELKETIEIIRRDPEISHIKILVGGYVFNQSQKLWKYVGADGYGKDAKESFEIAQSWMKKGQLS